MYTFSLFRLSLRTKNRVAAFHDLQYSTDNINELREKDVICNLCCFHQVKVNALSADNKKPPLQSVE